MAKPRMTQRDAWAKRPVVLRYHAFKDECALHRVSLPLSGSKVTFVVPMPRSWSKVKKRDMNNKPHQSTPDVDNLLKGLMDAVFDDDSVVWDVHITKIWGFTGEIRIETQTTSKQTHLCAVHQRELCHTLEAGT